MTKQLPLNHYGELARDDAHLAERAGEFYLSDLTGDFAPGPGNSPYRIDFERPVLVGPDVCSVPVRLENVRDQPAHVRVTHAGLLALRHVLDTTTLRQIGGAPFRLRLELQPAMGDLRDVLGLLERDFEAADLEQRVTHRKKMRNG